MHRAPLLDMLTAYEAMYPDEAETVGWVREFVQTHPDCFERSCKPGHLTASAWILGPDLDQFLLAHHKKLGRWLQLGGHADGETELHKVALREAHEESGLLDFGVLATDDQLLPLDIDVHKIPAQDGEPEHFHYDIRFLLLAQSDQVTASSESHELRWFPMAELEQVCQEESVFRMGEKAQVILEHMLHEHGPDCDHDHPQGDDEPEAGGHTHGPDCRH